MSNKNETELREAKIRATVCGYVKEIKLEEDNEVIRGSIVVDVGGDTEVSVGFYASQYTKVGTENKTYKGLVTVMENYVSMAEANSKDLPLSDVTKIKVNGKLTERSNKYGRIHHSVSSNYPPTSLKEFDDKQNKPRAVFQTEICMEKLVPEIKDDEETGRGIMSTIIPIYNGKVMKWDFIVQEKHFDTLNDIYSAGGTSEIWGDIISTVKYGETAKKESFGDESKDTFEYKVEEYVITGGTPSQYDEDDNKTFNKKAVKKALIVRDEEIESKKKDNSDSEERDEGFGESNPKKKKVEPIKKGFEEEDFEDDDTDSKKVDAIDDEDWDN